jgi:hypothetical protein
MTMECGEIDIIKKYTIYMEIRTINSHKTGKITMGQACAKYGKPKYT